MTNSLIVDLRISEAWNAMSVRRTIRTKGIWLLTVLVLGWVLLNATSHGVLIRSDPMLVNAKRIVTDAACVYTSGLRSATVFVIGQSTGAECRLFYEFGSLAPCPKASDLPPGSCQSSRDFAR